jgi:hypothetical protein
MPGRDRRSWGNVDGFSEDHRLRRGLLAASSGIFRMPWLGLIRSMGLRSTAGSDTFAYDGHHLPGPVIQRVSATRFRSSWGEADALQVGAIAIHQGANG